MSPNRRDFMKIAAGLGLAATVPAIPARATAPAAPPIESWILTSVMPLSEGMGGVSRMEWDPDRGWSLHMTPLCFDMDYLRDPDDQAGMLVADDYATPGDFLNAVVAAGTRPVATVQRFELATDHHDYVDRTPSDWPLPAPDESEEDLLNWFNSSGVDNGFSIVDTRRAISGRRPWANAVIRPSSHYYKHLRYYAQVRYNWD